MKIYKTLLFATITSLSLILLFWIFSSGLVAGGSAHSEFSTMSVGDDGNWTLNRLTFSLVFGITLFIILLAPFFVGLGNRLNKSSTLILMTAGVPVLLFLVIIFYSYQDYISADILELYSGFPLPTALLIYGIWCYPIIFTLLYLKNFKEWVISPEDIKRFKESLSVEKKLK